jgi:hypothetical protein
VESFNTSLQCGAAFGLQFYSPTTALPNSFYNNLTGVYLFFMSSGGNQARASYPAAADVRLKLR